MKYNITISFALIAIFALTLSSCQTSTQQDNDKLTIVTTIFPLYEFASNVAGDNAQVILLLPSGADPHHYEPRPSDIISIQNADVFLFVGEALEPWVHDAVESLPENIMVIEASEIVELIEGHDEEHEELEANKNETDEKHDHEYDPHVWLSFSNDIIIVESIRDTLISLDSENSETYTANAQEYIGKLVQLNQQYQNELSMCVQDEFISGSHNVFGYLEKAYGFHAIPAIENLAPDTEPTPRRMAEIIEIARNNNAKYILSEVLISQRLSDAIANEVGAEVLLFNPGVNKPDDNKDFIMIMQDNLEALKLALECN